MKAVWGNQLDDPHADQSSAMPSPSAHTLTLPASPREARSELARVLAERRWPGDVDAVLLVVHEAIVNAHSHAGGPRQVRVTFDGPVLSVELCDAGPGFDVPEEPSMPDPRAERGRGLWLMRQMADDVEVRRDASGVCLHVTFSGEPSAHDGSSSRAASPQRPSSRCG